MKREDALLKIEKILRQTIERGCTEAEARDAALMAQKLMVQYDISVEDVESDKPVGMENEGANLPANACPWKNNLAAVLAPNFRCVVYVQNGQIRFIGHNGDARIAARTLEYLYTVGHKLALSYSVKNKGGYNSWVRGFIDGIKAAFDVQRADIEAGTAIMIVVPQEATDALAELMGKGKWKNTKGNRESYRDSAAFADGHENGKAIVGNKRISEQ